MYSSQLLDHFQNPRNVGEIEDADAMAEAQNPACGDIVRLTLKIENGRISRARFKAQGCVPTVACGSALTELIIGKTIVEAKAVNSSDLVAKVGGVPSASTHAVALALEALLVALNAHRSRGLSEIVAR